MVKIEFQSMSVAILDFPIDKNNFFSKIKVVDFKKMLQNHDQILKIHLENTRLKFNNKVLVNKMTLSYYGIENNSVIFCEKYYEPSIVGNYWSILFGIQLNKTKTQDAITGDIDDTTRAKMSCGHYVKFFECIFFR